MPLPFIDVTLTMGPCHRCDRRAAVLLTYWEGFIIAQGRPENLKRVPMCGAHFLVLARQFLEMAGQAGITSTNCPDCLHEQPLHVDMLEWQGCIMINCPCARIEFE